MLGCLWSEYMCMDISSLLETKRPSSQVDPPGEFPYTGATYLAGKQGLEGRMRG